MAKLSLNPFKKSLSQRAVRAFKSTQPVLVNTAAVLTIATTLPLLVEVMAEVYQGSRRIISGGAKNIGARFTKRPTRDEQDVEYSDVG